MPECKAEKGQLSLHQAIRWRKREYRHLYLTWRAEAEKHLRWDCAKAWRAKDILNNVKKLDWDGYQLLLEPSGRLKALDRH